MQRVNNSLVLVDRPRPNIALITLNRPERMNSMAFDVMVPLKGVIEEITYDNDVRVVVLTGAGQGFSSGADHKSAGAVPDIDGLTRPTFALRSMEVLDDVIMGLRRMHQPVIAAVNGPAIGGGLCLALAADIRIASTRGVFPCRRHQQRPDRKRTRAQLSAAARDRGVAGVRDHAHRPRHRRRRGRADRVGVPEGARRTIAGDLLQVAEQIAAFSRPGVELTKRTLWTGLDAGTLEGHMQAEGLGSSSSACSPANFEEAVAARAEKRSPVFTDDRE